MLGMPKGPMQIEEDLAQIRNDIDVIRNEISWMKEYGFLITQVMLELKNIRRLIQVHQGDATLEETEKEVAEDEEIIEKYREAHALRRIE